MFASKIAACVGKISQMMGYANRFHVKNADFVSRLIVAETLYIDYIDPKLRRHTTFRSRGVLHTRRLYQLSLVVQAEFQDADQPNLNKSLLSYLCDISTRLEN
jgi:hypothetical protein